MNKTELCTAIEAKKEEIKAKLAGLDNFELDNDDYENQYRDMLEESSYLKEIGKAVLYLLCVVCLAAIALMA